MKFRWIFGAGILGAGLAALASVPAIAAPEADAALDRIAEQLVALEVAYDPTTAYQLGIPAPDHRRWPDRSPQAMAALDRARDAILDTLGSVDPAALSPRQRFIHAGIRERLEADRQARICRFELWAVNHMGGWHLGLDTVARDQPVATPEERAQALERWAALPALVDREIANARLGLSRGYSAPKAVVRRVIRQVDGIATSEPEALPFYAPGQRTEDQAFRTRLRATIAGPIRAAFARYRDFLQDEYLPRARDALGISANPDGAGCYAASLRGYTTLTRSPQEVFALGQRTVTGNMARVREVGQQQFATQDVAAITRRINDAQDNRFTSEEALIAYSRDVVGRAREASARLFAEMPAQEMRVEPFHAFMRGSGGSSYYERQIDPALPAFYRIASERWQTDTRGGAEITAVHEGYPGHHMQIALAGRTSTRPVDNLLFNSAFVEGWARYSEALAEEARIYQTPYALMTRRLWPARGMVVDPGLHAMGWTREQVIAFIRESGRFQGEDADEMVDRIAAIPGQLTAYDSGGLEIMALRQAAERALGTRFDVRSFHQRVLENGVIPLAALRAHVESWIEEQRSAAQ